jgi:phosphogluconate dehydratase
MSNFTLHPRVAEVTMRIRERSWAERDDYLKRMDAAANTVTTRSRLSCTNLAHGFASSEPTDKEAIRQLRWPNIAIINSYNDMLSAHQPLERFPRDPAHRGARGRRHRAGGRRCAGDVRWHHAGHAGHGAVAVQSRRDRDGHRGVTRAWHVRCDAVPGRVRQDRAGPADRRAGLRPSADHLRAGWTDALGVANKEKARIRKLFAEGKVGRAELLESEAGSYHSAGTCTFYGTANSNQMLMEVMGLHLPGSAFIPPNTPLRDALTAYAAKRAAQITALGKLTTGRWRA